MVQNFLYQKYIVKGAKILLVIGLIFLTAILMGRLWPNEQTRESRFIEEIALQTEELKEQTGILPSVTIAQAILESNFGESELAVKANNLFGVKGSYHGNSIKLPTKEYKNNKIYTTEDEFRAYPDWASALLDHANLFLEGTSWNKNQYQAVLAATNFKEAAHALKENDYSTDPKYPEKLIAIIEQYQLEKYD